MDLAHIEIHRSRQRSAEDHHLRIGHEHSVRHRQPDGVGRPRYDVVNGQIPASLAYGRLLEHARELFDGVGPARLQDGWHGSHGLQAADLSAEAHAPQAWDQRVTELGSYPRDPTRDRPRRDHARSDPGRELNV